MRYEDRECTVRAAALRWPVRDRDERAWAVVPTPAAGPQLSGTPGALAALVAATTAARVSAAVEAPAGDP